MSDLRRMLVVLLIYLWACGGVLAQVTLFAAASLAEIMEQGAREFEAETGSAVRLVVAGSSTLAQQIGAGAPADIFVSANRDWIGFAQEKAQFGSEKLLFGNRLVVIARTGNALEMSDLSMLAGLLGGGRLALGDPAHVPAGIYAKQALVNGGVWSQVKNALAPSANVRAALNLVALGAAPLGIVYGSDARDNRVHEIFQIPENLYEGIGYWGALNPNASEEVLDFFDFLQGNRMQEIALSFGFSALKGE